MEKEIRKTRSLCPICLQNLPAQLIEAEDGEITLQKQCPDHGSFSVPVWRGKVDFRRWVRAANPLSENDGLCCPKDCGICEEHQSGSCCVLLEVTKRCNLHCQFCFANGGTPEEDPPRKELEAAIRDIVRQCGQVLLQFSGGEPTLRDDLPELVRFAKAAGCSYVQVNTNGIRLAEDPDYAKALASAGLDIVFLQFDGTEDGIYETLRGKPMLAVKERVIEVCAALRIGVELVPTVVPGVNDYNLGDLVRYATNRIPAVRGIHFQPVSYFGRYPGQPGRSQRYTLDQLMADISAQADISLDSFMPSRCDHPLCGFHSSYLVAPDGTLRSLTSAALASKEQSCARENREYVARHWRCPPEDSRSQGVFSDEMEFDTFLYHIRHRSLTLSAMAFQDAENLNIERLHRCSLHVYSDGVVKPFCANYLTPMMSFE